MAGLMDVWWRLGELLVQNGAMRAEQVDRVLAVQLERRRLGLPARFGEVCVRMGWVEASDVSRALARQTLWTLDNDNAARVLADQGRLASEDVARSSADGPFTEEELAERLLTLGLCTPEELRVAQTVSRERRAAAIRRGVWSAFAPVNVMESLVSAEVGRALEQDGGCSCSQCWANITALSLNNLPPRYVTEIAALPVSLSRYGTELARDVADRVLRALAQVRSNPKMSCLSRFSDEILAEREAESRPEQVVVRVSARHLHLSEQDATRLFGPGHALRRKKDLAQPGQYAAEEVVALVGPKGRIDNVRVLGPYRKQTQLEISGTDQFALGIQAPVRESGRLDGTPGIRVAGPSGTVELKSGVIRALRHVHMPPAEAERLGLRNGARVAVRLAGDRATILEGVLVRATEGSAVEMHIDTDEANAAGVPAESQGWILVAK